MTSIYYFSPDDNVPRGGVKQLYRHVDVLNKKGFDAYLLHNSEGFRCAWFENTTRVIYPSMLKSKPKDIFVLPEVFGPKIEGFFPGLRKVIFNQNAYLTFLNYPLDGKIDSSPYLNAEVIAVFTVSDDNRKYLAHAFPNIRPYRIHYSYDPEIFYPGNDKRKQICLMPRKCFDDARQVINILRRRGALDGIELVIIENLPEKEVAKIFRESAIFLSFGWPEGCPMPPSEAMACGCFVIGYHGGGGRELFSPGFSCPVQLGDIVRFAEQVEEHIKILKASPDTIFGKGKAAADYIASNFSQRQEEEELETIWEGIINSANSPRIESQARPKVKTNAPILLVPEGHLGGYRQGGDPESWDPAAWEVLLHELQVRSLIDLGCGEGREAKWWFDRGISVTGIDGSRRAISDNVLPRESLLLHDYTIGPAPILKKVDLVLAVEFVEHVEEQYIPNYLSTFQSGRYVAFTHALPGQQGYHHVNCRDDAYWLNVMQERGWRFQQDLTEQVRAVSQGWFRRSGMIFS